MIKIESLTGDPGRSYVPVQFRTENRNKRSIALNLKSPESKTIVERLAAQSDIAIEGFRPGVAKRLGIDVESLRKANPKIICCSISGYGQDGGPWRDRPAYAPTVHADMGILDGTARLRGAEPFHDPYSHADLYTGHQCVIAILAALVDREHTGNGSRIDVSMAETTLFVNEHLATTMSRDEDTPPVPQDNRSPIFRTKEGHYVTVAGDPTPRGIFGAWCLVLGREDLKDDPRFTDDETRRKHRKDLLEIIQDWILTFDDLEALEAALQKGRIVLGVVRSLREAVHSPWAHERGAVVHVPDRGEGTVHVPNTPWRFAGMRTGVRGVPAYRGEHNREVFGELAGVSDEEMDRLEADGVLTARGPSKPERA